MLSVRNNGNIRLVDEYYNLNSFYAQLKIYNYSKQQKLYRVFTCISSFLHCLHSSGLSCQSGIYRSRQQFSH